MKASFDISTIEGQMKVFNAQNGASVSMKNMENGTIIPVVGVLQYDEKISGYSRDGQEQDATVTTLFAEDGTAYAGVSETVAKAGEKLIDFLNATGLEKINVKLVKAKSGSGKEFLNLQIVV